jgi:isoleucyl-tRNA synthetase
VRVRQPLRSLVVAGAGVDSLARYFDLVRDEVNVKEVRTAAEIEAFASFQLQPNARALGPRLGSAVQQVIREAKGGRWKALEGGRIEVAGHVLEPGEYALLLRPKDGVAAQALSTNVAIVVLDLELAPELVDEGRARDAVRAIQQARREAGLHVSDRIRVVLELPAEWRGSLQRFSAWVAEQTLAERLDLDGDVETAGFSLHTASVGGDPIRIGLARV